MRVEFTGNDERWTEEQNVQTFGSQTDRCEHHGTGEIGELSNGQQVFEPLARVADSFMPRT